MQRLFFLVFLLESFQLVFSRSAEEFCFSSTLIPLHIQNQMFNSVSGIRLSNQRRLQSAPGDPYIILITPSFPFTECSIGDDTQSSFEGLHIDYFNSIAYEIGWTQGIDYFFSCVNETELYRRVENNENVTSAMGGFVISSSAMSSGYRFSQPLENSGLNLLIRKEDPRTIWSFLLPISLRVGLGFLFATLAIGICIWYFEETKWERPFKEHLINFGEVIYDVFSSYYGTNAIELRRLSSRITQFALWVVILIFLAIYQADLTNKLSSNYVKREFQSINEAARTGKVLATAKAFQPLLKYNSIDSFEVRYYDGDEVETLLEEMIEDLRKERVDGLILPSDLTNYYNTQNCDLQDLKDLINEYNYGIIFPSSLDKYISGNISQAIIKLTETYKVQSLRNQFYTRLTNPDCDNEESISIKELAGLWIILAFAIAFSVIIHLLVKFKVIVPLQNYKTTYYSYQNQKTEIFESQLKEAVQYEMDKILMTYKDQLLEEVEDFENTLLLQNKKVEGEKDDTTRR